MASPKISLKLTIDTKSQTVLFAEVDKDFIEFLSSFLFFHFSTTFKLLDDNNNGGLPPNAAGCLFKFYQSFKVINDINFHMHKEMISKPQSFPYFIQPHLSLLSKEEDGLPKPQSWGSRSFETEFNRCGRCSPAVWCRYCRKCQNCGDTVFNDSWRPMGAKGVKTYMLMDDLVVSPMITRSTAESIAFLKKFNIKDVNAIEEKEVSIGKEEGLELLRHAYGSSKALTNVFLGRKINKRVKRKGVKEVVDLE